MRVILSLFLIPSLALAQSDFDRNTQNRTLIDQEAAKTRAAVDRKELDALAEAAQQWFFNPDKKHYMRIPHGQDGVRFEIPIDEIKSEGFLPADWADRYGTGQSVSVLGHPYVVSVARFPDPDGQAVTPFLPDEKFRFDILTTIGESSGTVLPPKPAKVPVYVRFVHQYVDDAGNTQSQTLAAPMLTDYLAMGGAGFPLDPGVANPSDIMTLLSSNIETYEPVRWTTGYPLNFWFQDMNGGSADWQSFIGQLATRYSDQLDASDMQLITNAATGIPSGNSGSPPFAVSCVEVTDSDPDFGDITANASGAPDGSYDNDRLINCRIILRPAGHIRCVDHFCNGGTVDQTVVMATNYFGNVVRDDQARPLYGLQSCLALRPAAYSCQPFEPRLWGNLATCADPVPSCGGGGTPPTGGCTGDTCGCDVYVPFEREFDRWDNLPGAPFIRYSANCDATMFDTTPESGAPRSRPVIEVAAEDTAGQCRINPDDNSQMLCVRFCDLYWDVDKDDIKDDPNPFYGGQYANCADGVDKVGGGAPGAPGSPGGNATGQAENFAERLKQTYNEDPSTTDPDKAAACIPSPPDAPTDPAVDGDVHEALCDKNASTGGNPEYLIAAERLRFAVGGVAGDMQDCKYNGACEPPEWSFVGCMARIDPWPHGSDVNPVASSALFVPNCEQRTDPEGRTYWFCHRSWRQSQYWSCDAGCGLHQTPPPVDSFATGACIDGAQVQVPWIKSPNWGTVVHGGQ